LASTQEERKETKDMNWDRIAGQWKQLEGHIRSKWANLTDDDLAAVGGKKETLVGKVQERYGILRDEAERRVDEWIAKMPPSSTDADSHGPKAKNP
jgi:uncharacterized protein YjbJ (UPF0337 family)